MTATQAPTAFVVAPVAPMEVSAIADRLSRATLAANWRGELLDIARELQALAIPAEGQDVPVWGILTTRQATKRDTRQQQDCGRVLIASVDRPMTYARVSNLVQLFHSDPYQTADYSYRILPFEQMQAEANA